MGEEGAGQVLGPEEYSTLMRIKDLKLMYREQFSELQMVGRGPRNPRCPVKTVFPPSFLPFLLKSVPSYLSPLFLLFM